MTTSLPSQNHRHLTIYSLAFLIVIIASYLQVSGTMQDFAYNLSTQLKHKVNPPKLRRDIITLIQNDQKKRNDGTSLIGTFVRLSWHASGTYSQHDDSGGSNGGRIRYNPERSWGANAGLDIAMDALDTYVKPNHPHLSYADLYTYAGVVSVEYAGGPQIPYEFGRVDYNEQTNNVVEDGRLPDADKGSQKKTARHMREVFQRMGFDDREMVCLIGAHTLGRCHIERSGYWGPWNKAENKFNNALFKFLLDMKWTVKKTHEGKWWSGPKQYENPSGELMMLPSCIAMIKDTEMKEYVEMYAADEDLFFQDFASAFGKLLALGVSL